MLRPGNGIGWILSVGACSGPGTVVRSTRRVLPLAEGYSPVIVVLHAHAVEGRELDLEELDRHPLDGDRGLGDDGGGEQAHRLDRVLARGVLDVDVDVGARRDRQGRRADALDAHAELLEEEAEVLDHVVGAGVADDRGARVTGGGHEDVLGDGVAALGEHDRAGAG